MTLSVSSYNVKSNTENHTTEQFFEGGAAYRVDMERAFLFS